jgi:predicted acetyltransferase
MMDLQLRDLDPKDVGRSFDIRTRAFGPLPEAVRPGWEKDGLIAIDERRMPAAYDGDLLVARALIRPFTQYWGGRPLRMAGVAGVVVSPEYRGQGVGTQLMTFVARRSRELGYPVSVLYPATFSVYRRTGWEVAGVWSRVTIETRLLRDLRDGGDVVVREVGPKDAAELVAIMRRRYTTDRPNGPLDSTVDELAEDLGDSTVFVYATDDGFVLYGWQDRGLVVHHMVAGSLATARALWSVVGSGSSIAEKVHAYLAPDDPIHHVLGEEVDTGLRVERWMLRLIDVEAALGGRGYPVAVDADIPLVVEDPALPENRLAGRLEVHGGVGRFVADSSVGDSGDFARLGPNGLAALYAGTSTSSLRASGLITRGGPDLDARLDAAFVGRPAYLLDYF